MGEYQKVVGIITLCVVALLPGELPAQDDGIESETLQVTVVEFAAIVSISGFTAAISSSLFWAITQSPAKHGEFSTLTTT
jgi:hypothetical protein